MGGYKDRTIRLDFPDLGKGCYVVIKNPALLPLEVPIAFPEEASTSERVALAHAHGRERVAAIVTEWSMWDVTQDDDVALALPAADPSVLERCPGMVLNRIAEEIQNRTNPSRPQASTTTKS